MHIFILLGYNIEKLNAFDNKSTTPWVGTKMYWNKKMTPEGNSNPQNRWSNICIKKKVKCDFFRICNKNKKYHYFLILLHLGN